MFRVRLFYLLFTFWCVCDVYVFFLFHFLFWLMSFKEKLYFFNFEYLFELSFCRRIRIGSFAFLACNTIQESEKFSSVRWKNVSLLKILMLFLFSFSFSSISSFFWCNLSVSVVRRSGLWVFVMDWVTSVRPLWFLLFESFESCYFLY